jgi:5-oxoprolinase (ATP-hydrolysing) subunit A
MVSLAKHGTLRSTIDLNADLGEGGVSDEALIACVSSVNIACGGHAGDDDSMRRAIRSAKEHGVAIGVHPSFADKLHFGRREMQLAPAELRGNLQQQIENFCAIAEQENATVKHIKPHGALYNQAARDAALAQLIAEVVHTINPDFILVGLAGSELIRAGQRLNLVTAEEVFADRRYTAKAQLVSRDIAGALIAEPEIALQQALHIVEHGSVKAISGEEISLHADTICVHGDGAHALDLARALRASLLERGVQLRAVGSV